MLVQNSVGRRPRRISNLLIRRNDGSNVDRIVRFVANIGTVSRLFGLKQHLEIARHLGF